MEHSYFKDKISAFHDKELKHEEEQLIAEHLETCEECQALLKELEKFDRMVEKHSGLADDDYWEKAAQKIDAAIEPETKTEVVDVKPSSFKGIGWKLAGVAASIAIITFIALHERDITDEVGIFDLPPDAPQAVTVTPPQVEADRFDTLAGRKDADMDELGAVEEMEADAAPAEVKRSGLKEPTADEKPGQETVALDNEIEVTAESKLHVRNKTSAVTITQPPASDTVALSKEDEPVTKKKEVIEFPAVQAYQHVPPGTVSVRAEMPMIAPQDIEGVRGRSGKVDQGFESSGLTVEHWRSKRDSLQAVIAEAGDVSGKGEGGLLREAFIPKSKISDKRALADAVDSISEELQEQDPQLQLLECHYMIASMTDNADERDEAVAYLKDYLEREDSEYKLQAAWYIQRLESAE